MNNVEVVCDACEARMRLSEGLLDRISGKTGRITCKQCANKIALDARGEELRVTSGGSLLAVDLEVEELEEVPHSGLDLIDPAFSEFPAEIKMKEEEFPDHSPDLSRSVPMTAQVSAAASGSGATSIPPPLPSDLQEKRRQSIAAKMEAPVPDGFRPDEDSLTPHSLGEEDDLPELEHAPPSAPFASERDETFRSLYPKQPEPQLAPAFSSTPSPPHKPSKPIGIAPLTPSAVVLGPDGKLHNRAEFGGSGSGGSTWLPWTVAAIALLALGVSLTAQLSGDFRQTLTSRADDPDASMMNYGEVDPAASHPGGLKELVQEDVVEEVPVVEEDAAKQSSAPAVPDAPVQAKVKGPSDGVVPSTKAPAMKKSNPSDEEETSPKDEPEQDVASSDEEETTAVEEPAPLFNQAAASTSFAEASALAQSCRLSGDPAGRATVVVTFANSGRVTRALVTGLHFAGTSMGGCIAGRFRSATVPAFSGDPVTVTRQVNIQ